MEQVFRGNPTHKVDAKGRVSIPADFRRVLDACDPNREPGSQPRFVLCFGDTRFPYYTVLTMSGMAEISERIAEMDEGDPDREALEDYYYTTAETLNVDDSGRLGLNADLRARIGITDQATFAGKGTTFRIYSPDAPKIATGRLTQALADLPEGRSINTLLPKKRKAEA